LVGVAYELHLKMVSFGCWIDWKRFWMLFHAIVQSYSVNQWTVLRNSFCSSLDLYSELMNSTGESVCSWIWHLLHFRNMRRKKY